MRGNSKGNPNEFSRHESELQSLYSLILYNDDHNHFQFVIDSLVDVCKHHPLQAEQCAFIAHHKGKCDVKNGVLEELRGLKDELQRRGLTAAISVVN
jgi:ATP-dependent Clp protease adaptor protein ClpS